MMVIVVIFIVDVTVIFLLFVVVAVSLISVSDYSTSMGCCPDDSKIPFLSPLVR